jgi:hypothetical protein
MLKFIGAMLVGLLTMGAAAYFVARPKEQRSSDFTTAKNLVTQVFTSIKNYVSELLNPKQPTEEIA